MDDILNGSVEARQRSADGFIRRAWIGAGATAVFLAVSMTTKGVIAVSTKPWFWLLGLLGLVLIDCIRQMFRDRRSDEYIEGLWNTGASVAFIGVLSWTFLRAFLVEMLKFRNLNSFADALAGGGLPNGFVVAATLFFGAVLIKHLRNA